MPRKLLISLLLLLATLLCRGEETIILGNILDEGSGAPIENATVVFKGTKIGTTSDADGFFYLRVDVLKPVKLQISAVGYHKQVFDINPGQSVGMQVLLKERIGSIEEIVVVPGVNPADELMRRVRAERKRNGELDKKEDAHGKSRYFVSNIPPRLLGRKLWRPLVANMIAMGDSTYMLPLPYDQTDAILPIPEHFDFYQPNIPIGTSAFLSPLAACGSAFYRYYIEDSIVVDYNGQREKHYTVGFRPKNTFDPLLSGSMTIDSATTALRFVVATMPRQANINYLNALYYQAEYNHHGELAQEQLSTLMDVAVKWDTTHTMPSLLSQRKNMSPWAMSAITVARSTDSVAQALIDKHYKSEIATLPDDSILDAAQDSIMQQPLFRFLRWATITGYTGYMPTGTPVDIGLISDIIHYSPEEKLHMGLPFKTNEKMSRYVSLGGYVGYGLRDHGVKYKAELQAILPTQNRHIIGISVSDRYAATDVSAFGAMRRENGITDGNLGFTTFAFNGLYYRKETAICTSARKRELRVYAENEWTQSWGAKPAVETQLSVQVGKQSYGDPLQYHYYDMPGYEYASLRGLVRLSWGERCADIYTVRRHQYSNMPTLYLGAEIGSYRMPTYQSGRYSMYGLLNLMLRQDIRLGACGTLSYLFEAGCVLGKVPYPLLNVMNGNQGYTYQPERFTLMNNNQYAADKYLLLHLNWNGHGVLFNRIPGVRYLRLHELVEMKLAYGGLSDKHRSVIDYTTLWGGTTSTFNPLTIPYTEIGIGLGNIFRIGEVYSVWRLTNRQDPTAANWGIRFRLHLGL